MNTAGKKEEEESLLEFTEQELLSNLTEAESNFTRETVGLLLLVLPADTGPRSCDFFFKFSDSDASTEKAESGAGSS